MRAGETFCPGILHAVPAKDGLLLRLRIPGGLIHVAQLSTVAALADTFADGQIEITSRANLQLRALQPGSVPQVAEALRLAGMLPSARHDRVRNIITSPLAGLDRQEHLDTRPLVRELDTRLIADDTFAELHPKWSFGIHGSSRRFSHEQDDLALQAIEGADRLQFFFGATDTGFAVKAEQAVNCLLAAAKLCISLGRHHGVAVRASKLAIFPAVPGSLLDALAPFLVSSPRSAGKQVTTLPPIGIHSETDAGLCTVVPSIPLGRLTARQAHQVANAAKNCDADLRLAPWRGIVLGAVPPDCAAGVAARLASVDLHCDNRAGFQGIAACAGVAGCDAALADVRADAKLLARSLAERSPVPGWTVHLSGCDKQCAMRRGAAAALVGTAAGYLVRVHGRLAPEPCSPDEALGLILAAHANIPSKGKAS